MLPKNKTKTTNATQFHSQNETEVETPACDLTGLIVSSILALIIGSVVMSAISNGQQSRQQSDGIIRELIKERAK